MILVVCPLPMEAELLRQGGLDPKRFRVEVGGHGKVEFALKTAKWIAEIHPPLVICAGAAGALSDKVQPLDLVIAETTIEHDFNLKFADRPRPTFTGHAAALAQLKACTFDYPVHFGAVASGDEDVIDSRRAKEIANLTSALAAAWEGAGGARAAAHARVPFLEIRGITDRADHATIDNFKKNLPLAMERVRSALSKV